MNGRELTADDVVYTYQRLTAQGDFTERPVRSTAAVDLPWESIEATDKYTVVMKLTEPSLGALEAIIADFLFWILPPEVIEQYGDYKDWQNTVGTGPHLALWPGVCLTVVVYSLNMFGDAVRDLLDPRLRSRLGRYGAGRE